MNASASAEALITSAHGVVRAGREVFLRGQSGLILDRDFLGLHDAAAQARIVIGNVQTPLAGGGATLADAVAPTINVTDRAWISPVMEIDVHAIRADD